MFDENLDAFLNINELGVAATYNATPIVVQLLNDYDTIGDGVGIEGSKPVALVKAPDVTGIVADDSITVDSVGYTVIRIEPDSTGKFLRLILNEV